MGGLSGNTSFEVCTPSQTFTYDAAKNLQKFNCSDKEYSNHITYTFAGWSDTPNGSVKYSDQQSVKNLATSGTKTLYASYKFERYNIDSVVSGDFVFNIPSQVNKLECFLKPDKTSDFEYWDLNDSKKTFTRNSRIDELRSTSLYSYDGNDWLEGCSAEISVVWSDNQIRAYNLVKGACVYYFSCKGTVS